MSETKIENPFNIDGSLVVITGGNTGIGKETARKLSWAGASVLIACRNLEKAALAKTDIESETGNPVKVLQLDLSSFESIKNFANKLIEQYGIPDVLINNAAIYSRKHIKSKDGIEMTMAVNYYAPFYLTSLILPHMLELKNEARIINVSSDAYSVGKYIPDLGKSRELKGFSAYALSKRALMYYSFDLAEKLINTNITVNCVHPGHSATGIWPSDIWYWKITKAFISINADPASYAAENIVYVASSPEMCGMSGKYLSNLKISKTKDNIFSFEEQKQLWDFTICELEELDILK